MLSSQALFDAAGRRRSPATTPGFVLGSPRAIRVRPILRTRRRSMRSSRSCARPPMIATGHRVNAVIVVLWRAGLRIQEAVSLAETDLDQRRGSILVRHGKNDRWREVGMDAWGWSALEPWLADRVQLPVGPLFCVIDGPTRGRAWSASSARIELHHLALKAGVRRRFAPHH